MHANRKDIRSQNLQNTEDKNFQGAIAGLSNQSIALIWTFSLVCLFLSVVVLALVGQIAGDRLGVGNFRDLLILLGMFLSFTFSIQMGLRFCLLVTVIASASIAILIILWNILTGFFMMSGFASSTAIMARAILNIGESFPVILVGFGMILTTLLLVIIFSVNELSSQFKYARVVTLVFAVIFAVVSSYSMAVADMAMITRTTATIYSLLGILLSYYLSHPKIIKSKDLIFLQNSSSVISTLLGTSFCKSSLHSANFTNAILRSTDFRGADLRHTIFHGAHGFEFSRLGNSYLQFPQVQRLFKSLKGEAQNFDGLNLEGINLEGLDLQNASLNGANLNQSILRNTNFSGAKLKQVRLDGADLTGAILTGAFIEGIGITNTTKLDNIQCTHVFMRIPTENHRNPLRKPDNEREQFKPGDFADFIKPYFDTLDLYHRQDIDPRTISITLKNLVENHPEAQLKFVAIEWRGNGLNIRYTTAPDVDKSELNHEYFTNYAQIRKEILGSIQLRLATQDAEISRMEGVIDKFIQTGTHQSTIQAETIQLIQGELVVTENRGININAGNNANISGLSSGDGVLNLGTISGNVTNAINQLPEALESDQPNLKELLTQLQQAIQADADLPDLDKADLLEQVQALAKAKQIEESAKREGLARKAKKMFDATLKSLPDTAKIVEACSKLLPLILKALGFPG
jgi:uncharacterized protein YjbI with pentapeptide repeats